MTTSPVAHVRRQMLAARRHRQQGVASAEYAVATAAGCGFAAVLMKLLLSDWGQNLLKSLFALIMKVVGL
jgi:hypothetical protein